MCNKLLVLLLDVTGDLPRLAASIAVDEHLKVLVSVDQKLISSSRYNDLLSGDSLQNLSQLMNIMARVKSWTSGVSSISLPLAVDMAVNSLKAGLDSVDDDDTRNTNAPSSSSNSCSC